MDDEPPALGAPQCLSYQPFIRVSTSCELSVVPLRPTLSLSNTSGRTNPLSVVLTLSFLLYTTKPASDDSPVGLWEYTDQSR